MYESAAGTAQGEGGADHQGEADVLCEFFSFKKRVGCLRRSDWYAHFDHPLAELFPVLGLVDGLDIDADETDAIFFPDTKVFSLFSQVQGGLSTHGWQYGIYLVLFQYLFNTFGCQRQEINFVGHHRVGHDSSRVAVDEDDLHPFFPQTAGGLGTGIVELTSLADDNRT